MRNVDVQPPPPCTGPCGRVLPLTDHYYPRDATARFGVKRRCRECCAAAERARYAENSPIILQRRRERRIERSAYFATTEYWERS